MSRHQALVLLRIRRTRPFVQGILPSEGRQRHPFQNDQVRRRSLPHVSRRSGMSRQDAQGPRRRDFRNRGDLLRQQSRMEVSANHFVLSRRNFRKKDVLIEKPANAGFFVSERRLNRLLPGNRNGGGSTGSAICTADPGNKPFSPRPPLPDLRFRTLGSVEHRLPPFSILQLS